MKNIIKSLFLLLICVGFTACKEDVGVVDPGPQGNPEQKIAGTYTGTWTRTLTGETTSTEATGTITFSPRGQFATDVTVSCPDLNLNLTSAANVVNYSDGYMFYNGEAKNGFGVTFQGRVVNGEATIKFTLTVKEGRKQYLYNYTFAGN